MSERRTFIVRVYAHDELPILEDVATGELVRLPGLRSIPDELTRRLKEITADAAAERQDGHLANDESRA
jgi:hypothetical protein